MNERVKEKRRRRGVKQRGRERKWEMASRLAGQGGTKC